MAEDSFTRATNMIIKLQDKNAQLKYALLENEYIQEKGLKFNEQDMIDFAEYVASYPDKNRNIHNQILHAKSKYDGAERTIDLLEIWLKEFKNK
jgi:ubiquitin